MIGTKFFGLAAGLLAAAAFSATLSTAQAQPYHHGGWNCRAQIERAEARYERAVRRHGRHSWEARERRRDLRRVRDRCDRYDHYDRRDHRGPY